VKKNKRENIEVNCPLGIQRKILGSGKFKRELGRVKIQPKIENNPMRAFFAKALYQAKQKKIRTDFNESAGSSLNG